MNTLKNSLATLVTAATLFLAAQKDITAQTQDNLTNNLTQTEKIQDTLTPERFLEGIGVEITDSNEKKLIETVW
jgi:hypothetical protein